jgi:hypothetical protein
MIESYSFGLRRLYTSVGRSEAFKPLPTVCANLCMTSPMSTYCDLCDRSFYTPHALQQHRQTATRHKRYCDSCEREFSSEWGLTQHYVQSPYHDYCQYCDEHFCDSDDLEDHYEDVHWLCKTCSKVSVSHVNPSTSTDQLKFNLVGFRLGGRFASALRAVECASLLPEMQTPLQHCKQPRHASSYFYSP